MVGGAIGGAIASGFDSAFKTFRDDVYWHANKRKQESFAKNSLSWKVADAKRAGIHPLAALGASSMSFSPQQVGAYNSSIGQDVSRAISAGHDKTTRELNERILRANARIAEANADAVEGQGNAGNSSDSSKPLPPVNKPPEIITSDSPNSGVEGGVHPTYMKARTLDGGIRLLKGEKATEATEEDFIASINLIVETYGLNALYKMYKPSINEITEKNKKLGHNDWYWNGAYFKSYKNKGPKMQRSHIPDRYQGNTGRDVAP